MARPKGRILPTFRAHVGDRLARLRGEPIEPPPPRPGKEILSDELDRIVSRYMASLGYDIGEAQALAARRAISQRFRAFVGSSEPGP